MPSHENEAMNLKQVATSEFSASARLDPATEERLYRLFREFFQKAEETRRWNLWSDVPWDAIATDPPRELSEAVLTAFREDSFLPDYSAHALHYLRASRGRAWFLTRWAYEEGKHLLALGEWLTKSGSISGDDLRELSNGLLATYTWQPEDRDNLFVWADALLWEMHEIDRFRALKQSAETAGDSALVELASRILTDEEAHRDFFRLSLAIIAERYGERVEAAIKEAAQAHESPEAGQTLLALLDL